MSQTAPTRGTVSYVNSAGQSGFIDTEETVQDVLFLSNSVVEFTPEAGEEVTFELVQTRDGPRATNLCRT